MAQLFPDDIVNSQDLSQLSHALCKIFEKNLSDEWECHAILDGPEISYFIVVSPDLGVLTLLISKCQPEQFDSFFQRIPELQQNCLGVIRNELQKNEHLCDENGALRFPIGFGMLFPELSSGELNISVGALSQFSIFADKLKEVSNSDDELEELLFDMVEEGDFDGLSQENLENITHAIPTFREKYPLPTEQETCTSTADTPQQETNHSHPNEGDNEMHEKRGIEHFLNHLEFLGYENKKLNTEDRAAFKCQHPQKIPLFLISSFELGMILFRCQWSVENIINDSQKTEVIKLLNNFNVHSLVTCNFLDDENNVVAQFMVFDIYSKVDFGRFIQIFTSQVEECRTITSELESKFAGKSDDIPF